ncbi:SEN34 subunit of tRNA-splicing endonuclease [Lentithecium fluviatile CBS 122367]|uniref:tRNA-splicing endonuclease subunit Sen34 n=1 Tax=Lentithecium fluviatile CBS 122367 TaxID=1168545 RepID=A0A6G1JDL3_9PLEO|nr:SEN34 subunit of tRNA-splicing endonuclease [Lentithecium fluviatile CBS 122367]
MAPDSNPVPSPLPISCITGRYLLFDIAVISHVRRTHNICGVLIGTIPNLSQQNVFLGIPLELTSEEARVLVERGHAYIVNDVKQHREGLMEMKRADRLEWMKELDRQGMEMSREALLKAEERSEKALRGKGLVGKGHGDTESVNSKAEGDAESLIDDAAKAPVAGVAPEKKLEPTFITPTTSHPPLPLAPISSALPLPAVPKSYPLFRYLHSRGYFFMPGLRFGCNYSVYPGDPLRFHSHFLATGVDWDEEFDLLDIIGGGRLGTGVKKAYLLGGEDSDAQAEVEENGLEVKPVRALSIEWAGL